MQLVLAALYPQSCLALPPIGKAMILESGLINGLRKSGITSLCHDGISDITINNKKVGGS